MRRRGADMAADSAGLGSAPWWRPRVELELEVATGPALRVAGFGLCFGSVIIGGLRTPVVAMAGVGGELLGRDGDERGRPALATPCRALLCAPGGLWWCLLRPISSFSRIWT